MRNVFAICRREIFAFFVSPVAYLVISGFVLLSAYFFFNLLGMYNLMLAQYSMMPSGAASAPNLNQWVVEGYYHTLLIILVFLIPMLTMRVVAEERRLGTFELLATSPLKVSEIVLGKFLGVGFVVLLMVLAAGIFPLLLCIFGNPEVKPILCGLAAVALCALGFTSLGVAISAFTENQIVAAVSGMVVLLLLYVIQQPAESVGGNIAAVLNYLSPVMQAKDMIRGVVSLQNLVYFASLMGLGIFVCQRALEAQRWR